MNTSYNAVIFDLDGTLLDTIYDLADSMNYALKKFGFPEQNLSKHKDAIGNGLKKYAQRLIPANAVSNELLEEFVPFVASHYRNNSTVKTVVFEGIYELLDFLSSKNVILNILSNKRDDFVKELAKHYFGNYNFLCATGELPGVPKKPDPKAALKIAQSCLVLPESTIFIGDSIYDIKTGKAATMKTIGVSWGYQSIDMLKAESPDFLAHSPKDIINYLKEL